MFAVNAGETPQVVGAFLDKTKLPLNVLLDSRKETVKRYGISGYPTTVIIGKDGIVRRVLVGSAGKPALQNEIDAALAAL